MKKGSVRVLHCVERRFNRKDLELSILWQGGKVSG